MSINTQFLETLTGYNARRASLSITARFMEHMAAYALRPVDFSVLTLIAHNPGITSRQICAALAILPPNLVLLLKALEKRDLIKKCAHPNDKRAQGLYLTDAGQTLQNQAQHTVRELENAAVAALSPEEVTTLNRLLGKLYG